MISNANSTKSFCFQNDLLSRTQAAQYLGVSAKTLAVWACTQRYHLPFIKVGRLVRYRRTDLEAFITERTIPCTEIESS